MDDGSKDDTTAVGLDYVEKFGCDKVKLDNFLNNLGKLHVFVKVFTNLLFYPSLSGSSAYPW